MVMSVPRQSLATASGMAPIIALSGWIFISPFWHMMDSTCHLDLIARVGLYTPDTMLLIDKVVHVSYFKDILVFTM